MKWLLLITLNVFASETTITEIMDEPYNLGVIKVSIGEPTELCMIDTGDDEYEYLDGECK